MMQTGFSTRNFLLRHFPILLLVVIPQGISAQQTKISDFVLFGVNSDCASCGVNMGSSTSISGGSVGSNKLVQSTGNVSFTGNIFSGGTVILANGNTIGGRITAANSASLTGNILSAGSSAVFMG